MLRRGLRTIIYAKVGDRAGFGTAGGRGASPGRPEGAGLGEGCGGGVAYVHGVACDESAVVVLVCVIVMCTWRLEW